jgi:hypothetical protein
MDQPTPNKSFLDEIVALWPIASTMGAGVIAWVTANWRATKVAEKKNAEMIVSLRERAHQTELELAQIRAVLSAATGLRFEQITLDMVQSMVAKKTVTLAELETFVLTMPRLMWFKRREGPGVFRMMQVSQVYADKYLGGDAVSYRDQLDTAIWPEDVAKAFAINDEAAFVSGSVVEVSELIHSPLTGVHGHFCGVKWSFQIGQETYVCGLGTHQNDTETCCTGHLIVPGTFAPP